MKDNTTIQRVSILHPAYIPLITKFIDAVEDFTQLTWRVVQGLRTWDEQARIYAQGRTIPGPIVTYSPPGYSWHNYGVAVDIAPIVNNQIDWNYDYSKLKALADANSLEMGLFFPHPDSDHFEHKFGLNIREAYHRYTVKDFIPGTQFIKVS